jgi:hypothetical protein
MFTVTMSGAPLYQTAKPIINAMRKLSEEGERYARFREDAMGWQYAGDEVSGEMQERLRAFPEYPSTSLVT